MEFIALLILYIGLLLDGFVWKFRKDDFLASEANRCLNHYCEAPKEWSSRGRLFSSGLAVIEENGKKRFVKQKKLCDLGILK